MKTYSKASTDVLTHIANMQSHFHPKLKDVTVDALFAFDEEHSGSVLKHQGYSAAAVVSITPLKGRALGTADAVIVVDRATWIDLKAPQRDALIDHELNHLYWDVDNEGRPKSDGLGRPKLGMRRHDLQIGFFTDILERHGDASFEARQARNMLVVVSQARFDFDGTSSVNRETGELHGAPSQSLRTVTVTLSRGEGGDSDAEPVDELYAKACEVVRRERKASVSFVQYQLLIGYNRAARLIETMEADGLVGPLRPDGGREVLAVTPEMAAVQASNAVAGGDPTNTDLSAENGMDPDLEADLQKFEDEARRGQQDFTSVSERGAIEHTGEAA
jgi:Ftsk gamma domain/Putative phage metallopeptidase